MPKQSKRFRALAGQRTDDSLPLAAAVEKLKKFGTTKFDQTVEIHMRLGVDPKQADQIIRGSVVLPHGIGRTQRVAVYAVVGKMSFDTANLKDNIDTFIHFVLGLKPNSVKGQYVKSVAICATMSPSVRVAI